MWVAIFAANASYCDRYSYADRSGKQMFPARVLTGDSRGDLSSNKSLRMPPEKTSSSGHTVRYDNVTSITGGSRVYITYNNDKAFPFYLITHR